MKDRLLSFTSRTLLAVDRRPRLVIATLHRVGGRSRIGPAQVEHHLRLIRRHFHPVLPSQLSRCERRSRLAMVTIDDCHADVFEHVFPIAERLGVPLVICTPTDFFLRRRWLWFDRFEWLFRNGQPDAFIVWNGAAYSLASPAAGMRLVTRLKYVSPAQRDAALGDIARQLGLRVPDAPTAEYRPVSPAEMDAMLASGLVELCAHTVTHTIATVLEPDALVAELARGKRELEAFCGRPVRAFCYPNGRAGDFDQRTTAAVAGAGYDLAFTSVEGVNRLGSNGALSRRDAGRLADPFRLRRYHAHMRPAVFEKMLSGLGAVQTRWRERRRNGAEAAAAPGAAAAWSSDRPADRASAPPNGSPSGRAEGAAAAELCPTSPIGRPG